MEPCDKSRNITHVKLADICIINDGRDFCLRCIVDSSSDSILSLIIEQFIQILNTDFCSIFKNMRCWNIDDLDPVFTKASCDFSGELSAGVIVVMDKIDIIKLLKEFPTL